MSTSADKFQTFGNSTRKESSASPSAKSQEEIKVDWKTSLTMGLSGETENQIACKRDWARLAMKLRSLCPETNWIFINDSSSELDLESIRKISTWVERIIATPEWPFPEEAIFTFESNFKQRWKLLLKDHQGQLPFSEPPKGVMVIPYRDKFCSGWIITEDISFESTKAGEA